MKQAVVLVDPDDRLNLDALQKQLPGWEILRGVENFNDLPNETDFLLPTNDKLEVRKCCVEEKQAFHFIVSSFKHESFYAHQLWKFMAGFEAQKDAKNSIRFCRGDSKHSSAGTNSTTSFLQR